MATIAHSLIHVAAGGPTIAAMMNSPTAIRVEISPRRPPDGVPAPSFIAFECVWMLNDHRSHAARLWVPVMAVGLTSHGLFQWSSQGWVDRCA